MTVVDNGRGIPVDMHPETGRPALEVVMTKLHAAGSSAAAATRSRGTARRRGIGGERLVGVAARGSAARRAAQLAGLRARRTPVRHAGAAWLLGQGTRISFLADDTIFEASDYEYRTLGAALRELAYLAAGLSITLVDERSDP